MKSKHAFYTQKLANLYLEQGYLDDAEKAFGALAEKEPECEVYRVSLALIARQKKKRDLVGLVRVWADLLRRERQSDETYNSLS